MGETLPPANYPHLLDLGCGPGIYTESFYKKGYDVSGMDFSERSIAYARNSSYQHKLKINYMQGDYTEIDFGSEYNLLTLIYCDFGVLSNTTRNKLLHNIYDSLLPGGVFLFDVFTPLRYSGIDETKQWSVAETCGNHNMKCFRVHIDIEFRDWGAVSGTKARGSHAVDVLYPFHGVGIFHNGQINICSRADGLHF